MAVIVNGDGILTGVSSLTTALDDITSGRGTVTGVATVGTLQLGAGVSISSPRSQNAAIFTNNSEFLTVDDAGRVGVGTVTPNSDAHPQNVGKINVGFITARSVAGDIDANTMVVAGLSTFTGVIDANGGVTGNVTGNLTGTASGNAVLTGSTNNTIVTVTGANAIQGEATLTYNGTDTFELQPASATPAIFIGDSNRTGAGQGLAQFRGNWNGTTVARITFDAGDDTTNKDDGIIRFDTAPSGSLVERLRITAAGLVGIGDNSPDRELVVTNSSSNSTIKIKASNAHTSQLIFSDTDLELVGRISMFHGSGSTQNSMLFDVAGSTRLTIDPSGHVGIHDSDPQVALHVQGGNGAVSPSSYSVLDLAIEDNAEAALGIIGNTYSSIYFGDAATVTQAGIVYNHSTNAIELRGSGNTARLTIASDGDVTISPSGDPVLTITGSGHPQVNLTSTSGTDHCSVNFGDSDDNNAGMIQYTNSNNKMQFHTNGSQRMIITSDGYLHVGTGHGNNNHRINGDGFTQGQTFFVVSAYNSSSQDTAIFFGVNSMGGNTASCAIKVGKNSSNSRSINAGGTINASGSDYAEYMTKASDFTLAKGDICGINAEGKLTNKFSESISFVVKSTNPSYVGGDTWGGEDILGEKPKDDSPDLPAYELKMESARKLVDRVAFSGQVPVNVTGTTAGQHIIPTAGSGDTIVGVAKAEASLTMAEYISSIGKVIALESDGRARIIVKVS